MHSSNPFNSGSDQLKTLYTNLGSANNQVQLKYITGQGLLSPLIIRASDLGLGPEQAQLQGLPDFLNDFNNLNQQNANQFMIRPIKHQQEDQLFQRPPPDLFSDGIMKRPPKRMKRKRKKEPIFKFNSEPDDSMKDSMEFGKSNSMEFNRHNSMEFSTLNSPMKKPKYSFEKSYDDLVNSAKKLADTIENSSDNDDLNIESEIKEKKSPNNYENDKFNFDDDIKISQKDEDELDNLEKIENISGFDGGISSSGNVQGNKKNMNSDNFKDDFESVEKNAFATSADNDKFSDLFSNDKFSDLFGEKSKDNDENDEDNYDKLYDKIINKIHGKDKKKEKSTNFNENLFEDKKKIKKKNKKKPATDDDSNGGDTTGQFTNENTSDDVATNNKYQDDTKTNNENDQTEYNTNTSGTTDTGEYDYAGYAKDPSEQSEEITDNDTDKTPDKNPDKGPTDTNNYGDKYQDDAGGKYQDDQQTATSSPSTPENTPDNYKEQPQSTGEERSFGTFRSNQPFTRLKVKNVRSSTKKLNTPLNLKEKSNNRSNQLVRVRSKRIHQSH